MYIFGACQSYHCTECGNDFSKIGNKKEDKKIVICTHCESKKTITNSEFLELQKIEEEEKKKLAEDNE